MSRVIFTYKDGRTRTMNRADARFLQAARRGTFSAPVPAAAVPAAVDLDGMDAVALRALAQERDVKVHHNAGAEKIREALRQAQA